MECLQQIEQDSQQLDEMVQAIVTDHCEALDNYLANVRALFMSGKEISDADLNNIILMIPTYLYYLIDIVTKTEMRRGVSDEQAKYAKNEALLNAVGTVGEKQAKAENATIEERMKFLAYKTATAVIQRKIDGAEAIWESAKKVQRQRLQEKSLIAGAGGSVGAF